MILNSLDVKARAKINLMLDVLGPRGDGYNNIRTIMQTISLCDDVTVSLSDVIGIRIHCDFEGIPLGPDNLAYKAAFKMMHVADEKASGLGVDVSINKRIPMAAGLAGGSADAAAVIVALNKMLRTNLDDDIMRNIATSIGADVPFCLRGGTMFAEGVGNILTALPSPPKGLIVALATPPIAVSTSTVFEALNINEERPIPSPDAIRRGLAAGDVYQIAEGMANVLENVTVQWYPVIAAVKDIFMRYGAISAIMSGSGPSIFAIFKGEERAREAIGQVEEKVRNVRCFLTEFE